ncbi:serine hydrolase family protein [Campylobacter sp. MIT 99-7217]|nr:serine hydrolase family protein [Campylobacter sp. MIT 99-7217]
MQKEVYIVHGFDANPSKHWFSWLKDELEKEGAKVNVLTMPNPTDPKLSEWVKTLQKQIKVGENTYIVGHSLGCITILRYLDKLKKNQKIGGVVLVSGFYEKLSILPQLDSFVNPTLDFEKVSKIAQERVVISSRDDMIVPTNLSSNLALKFKATFIQTELGKHFMQDDGFTSFPLVLSVLNAMFVDKR